MTMKVVNEDEGGKTGDSFLKPMMVSGIGGYVYSSMLFCDVN